MAWRWWLVLAALALLGVASARKHGRSRKAGTQAPEAALARQLTEWRAGERTLVYFSGPGCSACHSQRHVLAQLEGVRIIERDATAEPELAREWGVRTLPTLFVLSAQGHIQHHHCGFVPLRQLLGELAPPVTLPPA